MRRAIRRRPRGGDGEAGLTLVEMLVALTMSVVIVAAATTMLISAVKDQPGLSRKSQNVTTARWQLERVIREVRNAVKVETATGGEVVLVAQVRRVSCGGAVATSPSAQPIECRVTYRCAATSCTRTESSRDGLVSGSATVAFSGIGNPQDVFCFVPSAAADPTECGPPRGGSEAPTYVGVNLEVPNPEGSGLLTISDGATLRTATFAG